MLRPPRPFCIVTTALVCLLISRGAAANSIVNGTFDDNTTGWTGTYNVLNGPAGNFPVLDTGPYYWAGNVTTNQITQEHTLSVSEQDSLAGPGLAYSMSADLFGFEDHADYSVFSAEFLDAGAGSLGLVSLSALTQDPGLWPDPLTAGTLPSFQSTTGLVPAGTASILFSVDTTRVVGTSNDGYADNLSFEMTAVPEPTAIVLLLSGMLAIGVRILLRSHRRRS
jgi:hypothetical protein